MSECPVCEKAILGDPGVVRRHLVAFHGGKRNNTAERLTAEEHECQVCLKVFFVRDRRDGHLKNEHHRCDLTATFDNRDMYLIGYLLIFTVLLGRFKLPQNVQGGGKTFQGRFEL